MFSGNEALIIHVLARDFFRFFFFTPCMWVFSVGCRYCESEGKCTACQAHNRIILLFQYVRESLCKEEVVGTENGDLHCREAGECSGTVQGSTAVRRGRACASATLPVLLGSGGCCLGLTLSHCMSQENG